LKCPLFTQDLYVLDIRNLERRWLKYKIKSYTPHIAIIFTGIIFIVIFLYIWDHSKTPNVPLKKEIVISTTSKNIPNKNAKVEASSTVLEPSMDFVQTFQTSIPPTQTSTPITPKIEKPLKEGIPIPKTLTVPDSVPLKSASSVTPISNNKVLPPLNHNESKLDIEDVERRFKETSNSNLGLFIARYHYDHGNYNEAYNFALKTNTLNSKIDESWIIFVKSLVKLGKIEQAKKTLQAYISESNSESARSLLDSIERGTFK
jgi:hypothetical protein